MATPLSRRQVLQSLPAAASLMSLRCASPQPLAVLTLDDAVKSHRNFVAPLLNELGFGATFFVTHRWMDDAENFMTWQDIGEIHKMGFEIGNHSWTHSNFSTPMAAARLAGELALVENELAKVDVPRPVSFAWCGNGFGPEALRLIEDLGFRFARRGMQPEIEYGTLGIGPVFDPAAHHRLLIPTTGDAYPDWTLEQFKQVVSKAQPGRAVVLQFHGVPDTAHPWVHTPPEHFRQYMNHLKAEGFQVVALRDLEALIGATPDDPMTAARYPKPEDGSLELPTEVAATRADLAAWTDVMLRHRYSVEEAALVAGFDDQSARRYAERLEARPAPTAQAKVEIHPYPGGRHPRIGFLEDAIDPQRGTKASVFLPWDPEQYVVVDLPELITSTVGHLYLAHTHVPTIWNSRNVVIENVDWSRRPDGGLASEWLLPNEVSFGASLSPRERSVEMELWLKNGTEETLQGLRTQICAMLKGAPDFSEQSITNKVLEPPAAAVRSKDGERAILTAWERTGRSWGNERCPCFHADPVFPDCEPGATVKLRGRLWFHDGNDIDEAMRNLPFAALGDNA